MISWHDAYSKTLEQVSKNFFKKRNAIIGFNVNIDKIIEITPKTISLALPGGIDLKSIDKMKFPSSINTIEDFLFYFLDSMKSGKAAEIVISSIEIANWIENNFEINNIQIGGQAGIIANLFKNINVGNVLLSLPTYDSKLVNLLEPTLLTVVEEANSYSICEIKELEFTENEPISHYIFEFKAGNYEINSIKFVAPRDNRFIVSYDKVNSMVKFSKGFYEFSPNFISEYSLAIISGFHLVNEQLNSYEGIINPIIKMIERWKKVNPDLYIHLEIASTNNVKLRNFVKKNLFPLVNSIGVNEQELIFFSSTRKEQEVKRLDQQNTSTTLFQFLHGLFSEYSHLRIHLHYLGYFLVISPVISNKEADMAKKALILSSYFAALKAKKGSIGSFHEIHDVELNLSSKGYEELKNLQLYLESQFNVKGNLFKTGILETPSFSLIGIPSILVKNSRKLVGLGDTISSIAVLFSIDY